MDLVPITEFLVKSVVKNEDAVSVKQYDDEEDVITIEVLVDKENMGSLIGKQGNVVSAIRTIVIASTYNSDTKKRIKISFDSF